MKLGRIKYPDDDYGILERTMFQQHDKGYCLRPEPCLCDEGRYSLDRIRRSMESARSDIERYRKQLHELRVEIARLRREAVPPRPDIHWEDGTEGAHYAYAGCCKHARRGDVR